MSDNEKETSRVWESESGDERLEVVHKPGELDDGRAHWVTETELLIDEDGTLIHREKHVDLSEGER